MKPSPASETELLERATLLAGKTLGAIAAEADFSLPVSMKRAKGWAGLLVEHFLGASAGSQPGPDFPDLGIELKTLPLDRYGKPRESTYVCTVSPRNDLQTPWHISRVRQKLARVLWIPVEALPAIPLAQRRIGTPVLWRPDAFQENLLRKDWEELTDMIRHGELDKITARYGQCLQIRPKARNSRSLQTSSGPEGHPEKTLPRGYYLRADFTQQILDIHQ